MTTMSFQLMVVALNLVRWSTAYHLTRLKVRLVKHLPVLSNIKTVQDEELNPFTYKISIVILLTFYHITLVM